ncbi:MAG: Hsp20/alpha crystallin family protein [Pirellulales bacterium]
MLPALSHSRFNTLFPQQFRSPRREMEDLTNQLWHNGNGHGRTWMTPISVWEEDGRFCLEADMPGITIDDLELTVRDGRLSIVAERTPSDESRCYTFNERSFGRVARTVTLPDKIDPDSIEAELKDGVLRVWLGKRPDAQPKLIEVKAPISK